MSTPPSTVAVALCRCTAWAAYHGVEKREADLIVYKAVDDRWTTSRGFNYAPGKTVAAPDWRADFSCGGGLHFGPTPRHARDYFPDATRFVQVAIDPAEARPIAGGGTAKIKARSCVVLAEVDIDGEPVAEVTR